MLRISNTPGEGYRFSLKPDSSSSIYITLVKEYKCSIVADNRRKR